MAKKNVPIIPGLRYLCNRIDTRKWDELDADTLIDWAKQDNDSAVLERLTAWLTQEACHGKVFVMGVNRIVAINLV
jgi:hypothetical protein